MMYYIWDYRVSGLYPLLNILKEHNVLGSGSVSIFRRKAGEAPTQLSKCLPTLSPEYGNRSSFWSIVLLKLFGTVSLNKMFTLTYKAMLSSRCKLSNVCWLVQLTTVIENFYSLLSFVLSVQVMTDSAHMNWLVKQIILTYIK
jgi:hypothetical protein